MRKPIDPRVTRREVKLAVSAEILRVLSGEQLAGARGGGNSRVISLCTSTDLARSPC